MPVHFLLKRIHCFSGCFDFGVLTLKSVFFYSFLDLVIFSKGNCFWKEMKQSNISDFQEYHWWKYGVSHVFVCTGGDACKFFFVFSAKKRIQCRFPILTDSHLEIKLPKGRCWKTSPRRCFWKKTTLDMGLFGINHFISNNQVVEEHRNSEAFFFLELREDRWLHYFGWGKSRSPCGISRWSQGFRQCTAALLRSGADPDVANAGRTPLMEADRVILLMVQKSCVHQLRLVLVVEIPLFAGFYIYIPGGAGFLPSTVYWELVFFSWIWISSGFFCIETGREIRKGQ